MLLSFHRVLSVQLTMPQIHLEEPLSDADDELERKVDDDDDDVMVPGSSLRRHSLEGAAVAVH